MNIPQDLDMTTLQVKAYLLGALMAEKPRSFEAAFKDMAEEVQGNDVFKKQTEALYLELKKDLKKSLAETFLSILEEENFFELAQDQLDFFLTALSLSGTHFENCSDENLGEFIDALEDLLMEMEDAPLEEHKEDYQSYFQTFIESL